MPNAKPVEPDNSTIGGQPLTTSQLADLANEQKQAEYQKAYFEQLRKRACPGCSESSPF